MKCELSGKQDVYLDIADKFEEYIRAGIYRNGEKLPSVRVAAGDMGVNPNTVAKAYTVLEERGLVRALPKKGAFVTLTEENEPDSLAQLAQIVRELKTSGITRDDFEKILREVYGE